MKEDRFPLFALMRSIVGWFLVTVVTLTLFPPILPAAGALFLFDRNRKHIHPIVSLWAHTVTFVLPVMQVRIVGGCYLKRDSVYVLVANHQSIADIIAVLHLSHPFKFIAKKELFWIPVFGWALTLAGYIPLVRGDRLSGKQAIDRAARCLEKGVSVLFFPEGTRSRDGEIHEFKAGAFKIAAELGIPVVPIVIDGTRELVPKGNFMIGSRRQVTVNIGSPRLPLKPSNGGLDAFIQRTREEMIDSLKQLRARKLTGSRT